jgi:hypothetical protein
MLQKLVDNIYVISLKSSEGRRKNILEQCHSIGTHFEMVDAIDGRKENVDWVQNEYNKGYDGWTQGAAGLVHTTIGIIKDAKKKGYDSIMIMEDDIVFKPGVYDDAKKAFSSLPKRWELLHLAAQHYRPASRSGGLMLCTGAWSCQIYAINSSIFDEYLEWLELIDRPIDSITSNVFHPRGNSFSSRRDLIRTIPNFSTIRDMKMNYGPRN